MELSRVSEAFLLLTDDREALIERLEVHDGSGDGALEALGMDPAEPPAVDPEVFAALAEDWRALLQEGEETNTVAFFLPGYREVMGRAAALAQIEDLAEDMRRVTDTMRAEHEGHLAREREMRGLVERIRGHWRRWPELGWAASSQGRPVEKLPEYDAWREEGLALVAAGRTRLGAHGEAARHLHAMPGGRAGLEGAVETLERTRLLDEARRFERTWRKVRERAAENGVPERYAPGHRGVAARVALGPEALREQALHAAFQFRDDLNAFVERAGQLDVHPFYLEGYAQLAERVSPLYQLDHQSDEVRRYLSEFDQWDRGQRAARERCQPPRGARCASPRLRGARARGQAGGAQGGGKPRAAGLDKPAQGSRQSG